MTPFGDAGIEPVRLSIDQLLSIELRVCSQLERVGLTRGIEPRTSHLGKDRVRIDPTPGGVKGVHTET